MTKGRTLPSSLLLLALGASSTAAQAPPAATTAEAPDVAACLGRLRAARSAIEAYADLGALGRAGEPGFDALAALSGDTSIHPEVRFHAARAAIGHASPRATALAARYVGDPDADLRRYAARILTERAEPKAAPALLAAARVEKDLAIRVLLLQALGLTGSPDATAYLRGLLDARETGAVLHGAAWGLAKLRDADSAARMVALADTPDLETWVVDGLLGSADEALGNPGPERVLALAGDPGSPLRAYGLRQARLGLPPRLATAWEASARALGAAARPALADSRGAVRRQAVLALGTASESPFGYVSDPEVLTALLARLDDPDAGVRLSVLDALHYTAQRRGVVLPGSTPLPLEPVTMRMLRWPSDWRLVPALLGSLDDEAPAVRDRGARLLALATGEAHGWPDMELQGSPRIDAAVRAAYSAVWERMREAEPEAYARAVLDAAVQALVGSEDPGADAARMMGVRLLTGRDFGWRPGGSIEERTRALGALESWWTASRGRRPPEWILDAEAGGATPNDLHLWALGRWTRAPMPATLLGSRPDAGSPPATAAAIRAWWDAAPDTAPSR